MTEIIAIALLAAFIWFLFARYRKPSWKEQQRDFDRRTEE